MSTREQIVAEARTWLGTPYHHCGKVRGPEGAVDCLMLVVAVFQATGFVEEDFEPRPYAVNWHLHRSEEIYLAGIEKYAHRVEAPLPGDLAMYKLGRAVSHAAIIVGEDRILHAYQTEGWVTISDMHHIRGHLHSFWSVIR